MSKSHWIAAGVLLAVAVLVPRSRTEPANAPQVISRPEYGYPVNNGYPSLAAGKGGELWLAWVSRRTRELRRFGSDADLEPHDQIWLKRRDANGWSKEVRVSPDMTLDGDPAVAADATGAWVIWSRRRNGRYDLMARHVAADLSMSDAVAVTNTPEPDATPRAVTGPDGTLWIAWESDRKICVVSHRNGAWTATEPISRDVAYRPALAISPDGVVTVVWDGGAAERYGVSLRQQSAGRWSEIRRVPTPAGLDSYAPRVAAANGARAWICYAHNPEPAAEWGLRGWRPAPMPRPSVWAVLWNGEGWQSAGRIAANADMPDIAVSAQGGVQVILTRLKSHVNFRLWESHLAANGWSEPRQLDVDEEEYSHIAFPGAPKVRMDQRPALALSGNRLAIAYERGTGMSLNRQIAVREIDAATERAPESSLTRAEAAQQPPFSTAREPHSLGDYQVYFGDIHTHLLMDDGWTGTADQFYTFARDRRRLDFAAYTPHAESNKLLGSEIALVQRVARQFNQPGRFCAIPGWEWTQGDFKIPPEGHKHILNESDDEERFFSSTEAGSDTSAELTRHMKKTRGIMFAHHVARGQTGGANFDTIDPAVEPDIEIASHWGRFEFFRNPGHTRDETAGSSVQDAWRRGLRLGVVGGSDNHDLFMERATALTAVLARTLDRAGIFDALRNRRCYATTGEKIVLDVRVNGALMGSVIRAQSAPVIQVKVKGTDTLEKVEVIKFSKSSPHPFPTAYAITPNAREASFDWKDLAFDSDAAYYVRVTQHADERIVSKKNFGSATSFPNEMAWSSPVWVEKTK